MTPYRERREAGHYDAQDNPSPEPVATAPEPETSWTAPTDLTKAELMTKAELIEKAQAMGISPANAAMSKAELVEAIEAAEG